MNDTATSRSEVAKTSTHIREIDILWLTAGLGCDGDTIAMTGATQPSIEEVVMGGIHAMEGNPTGAMGLPDYLGWDWKSKAKIPIVCVPGCPVQPDNMMETSSTFFM